MENTELGKYTRSFGLSLAITSVLSALIVIIKETNEESVLAWMKAATGHHWVTHGVINIVLFVVIGWALSMPNAGKGVNVGGNGLVGSIVGAVLLSGLLIAGFYL